MPVLEYDFRVVGADAVKKAISSIEQRVVAMNARVGRITGARATSTGSRTASSSTLRQADAEGRKLMREQARQQEYWHRARSNAERQRHREELAAIRKRDAEERRAARERIAESRRIARARADFGRATLGGIGGGFSRVAGSIRSVGGMALALSGIAGAGLAAAAVSQATKLDEMTRRLSILGRGKGEAGIDPKVLERQFVRTGIATGFSPESIAAGVATFTAKTGDIDTPLKNQQVFATVAQGAGAMVEEVFAAAADLSTKLDISSVEQMAEAFAILSAQGKKGSFELKAMAGEFPEVLASAASAGVRGVAGVRDVGAIMQLARQASGSDAEASTAVQAMFRQLAAKSADIQSGKAFGGRGKVQVFEGGDARRPMRNFVDVVSEVIATSGGDITQLQEIFDIRGIRAVNPMIAAFREASAAAGGGKKGVEAGKDAVRKIFGDFQNVSSDFSEVQRDAADAMKSFSVQMEIVNTQLKQAVASELFPELVKLAPRIAELVPHVARLTRELVGLAEWVAKNPLEGLGAAIGVAVSAELGKAGLGGILNAAITGSLAKTTIGSISLTAGSVALAFGALAAAGDQATKLNKELGGSGESLNPLTDKGGKFSIGSAFQALMSFQPGNVIGATAMDLGRGDKSFALRLLKSQFEIARGAVDFVTGDIARPTSQKGSPLSTSEQIMAQQAERKQAADEFAARLAAAADEAGEILKAKVASVPLNRGDSPSGVKPNPGG